MERLTVGLVAQRTGVGPQTLHYYERRGLLPDVSRSSANYRLYGEESVRRVRFIKTAQELGFTLEEIQELLALRAESGDRCDEVRLRAEAKVAAVQEKIRSLKAIERVLLRLIDQCGRQRATPDCPILAALDAQGETTEVKDA